MNIIIAAIVIAALYALYILYNAAKICGSKFSTDTISCYFKFLWHRLVLVKQAIIVST